MYCLLCIVLDVFCVLGFFVTSCVLLYLVCIVLNIFVYWVIILRVFSLLMCIVLLSVYCCFAYLVAGLLARSKYPEGPATDYLGTGFYRFPCV